MSEITLILKVDAVQTYDGLTPSELNIETIRKFFEKHIAEACEISQDRCSIHFVSLTEQE